MKKFLSVILAVVLIVSTIPLVAVATTDSNTVVLYTNDVHCAIDDYAVLAAYKAQLEAEGNTVITVDAGDAIQGEVIGALTQGEAIVDIMNTVGYDYAVPGNHEYDYGMETFLDIAENKADYQYISSNFYYLPSVSCVFEPYSIEDIGDYQIAFVGIATPEAITKANPEYFKDEGNNFIYGFPKYPEEVTNEALYDNIQESIDDAIADGADVVIAVGHLGIQETTDGWKSTDVIANTNGIDYFIDAHSHEAIEADTYKNIDNEDVFLSSTGTKFANFGQLTISADGTAKFELINPDEVNVETMSAEAKSAYNTVKNKVDGYNDEIAYLYEVIGTSYANLVAYDEDGTWAVRKRETNAGDFVADAYRAVTGADVALCNGGGVRAEIGIGDVTRKMLMDVNAFNNDMCVIEVTGQQLIDVLEHGARECPESLGSFFQVSGVTFEIHTWRESPVITDQLGNFIEIDETMERRVANVSVGGEPIELDKTYTLAGSAYVLMQGGDGLTMLDGATVVQYEGLPCDSEMLIKYLEMLGGKITAEKYGNPDGDGRIKIINNDPDAFEYDYIIKYGETITVSAPNYDSEEFAIIKFVPETNGNFALVSESNGEIDPICKLYDAGMNHLDENDDTNGSDFCLNYVFFAGETYYFAVATYSQEAEFDVSLVCAHSFEDGTCTVCGEICDHSKIAFLGYCLCEEVFWGTDINDGDEYVLENESEDEIFWFRFTPEISGTYSLKSVSEDADPDCFLYDADGEWLAENYDENGMDFDLVYYFEAGETYYFDTHNCYAESAFKVILNRLTHIADDGSEHDVEFVEETYSTCTECGYTDGLYCLICDKFVSGHEEKELSDWHPDDDGDDICDDCGNEIIGDEDETECKHMCHSDNFFKRIIWSIVRFFSSIFGTNPVCECGEAHY